MISSVVVTVLESSSLEDEEDDEPGFPNNDSMNEGNSGNWRDCSSEEELEDEDDSDKLVGSAGAVVLVTIWRLTCRGK